MTLFLKMFFFWIMSHDYFLPYYCVCSNVRRMCGDILISRLYVVHCLGSTCKLLLDDLKKNFHSGF